MQVDKRQVNLKFNFEIVIIKHNTYPPIKTFDGITSIVKNQSNMVIRAFI